MNTTLWQPNYSSVHHSAIENFASRYAGCSATDYYSLHQWSLENPDKFWSSLWDFCRIRGNKGISPWIIQGNHIKDTTWFPEASLNYAQNLLHPDDESTAIIFRSENGDRRVISHAQLYTQVSHFAYFLRSQGVTVNDRVSACMPNCIETIIAFLATASIGAIWVSCSPDFGVQGILDRLSQVNPKVLLCIESYSWKGKVIDITQKMNAVIKGLPSLVCAVDVPFLDLGSDTTTITKATHWNDALDNSARSINFEHLSFNHPLYILFSSGTTGMPKCIVHRAGGMLLQHVKEIRLHNDIGEGDIAFFYTTCGWMMWNWLVSALATKATLLLYDGSPLYPHPAVLFDYAEEEGVSFFGTSARYIAALQNAKVSLRHSHDLKELEAIASTGSVLADESFDYVYQHIKPSVRLSSMSGGTDIASCLVLGNPALPVKRGQIQCAGLGMHVAIADSKGHSVIEQKGELICRNALPCMPLGFWQDKDGSAYTKAYYSTFDNVWTHGDFALQTGDGSFVIYGRSDATLNPGGVRIGTAEIYRQVNKIEQIIESVVVGQHWKSDVRVILFVQLVKGAVLDKALKKLICQNILANTTPRHVPDKIIAVSDIPQTRNGKVVELAIADVIAGRKIQNLASIANPEALEHYRNLEELEH